MKKNNLLFLLLIAQIIDFSLMPSVTFAKPKINASKETSIKWQLANPLKGKEIYFKNCAYCHAKTGDGKNWIGSFILPHPRNFTDKNVMKDISRERMFQSVLKGRPGTAMPTWEGLLSEDEIRDVISFIEQKYIKR